MNKMIRFFQTYLICGFPFVIITMVLSTIWPQETGIKSTGMLAKIGWDILGWNIMIWFAVLILYLVILVAIPRIREKTLRRLANLKERDEREEYITGKASRAAYISTLSLMIFFLFFSIFSFSIYKLPKEKMINGHHYSMTISMGFSLLDKTQTEEGLKENIIFNSKDYSLSATAIILLLLSWQLAAFNLVARNEQKT